MPHQVAIIATAVTLVLVVLADRIGISVIKRSRRGQPEKYRDRQILGIVLSVATVVVLISFWGGQFQSKGTFFGLFAAGLAVALRDPLLSIAGRISIFAGRMYAVGDRIEIEKMAGDVIGIGFFYTRMLEIGNWMRADQATGRTVLFSNSRVYQHAIFNYTQNFPYIWDEVVLPVTYASDLKEATRILLEAGEKQTKEFVRLAERELELMRDRYLVPEEKFGPTVFTKVTSNYVELTMRYIVSPRQRRAVSSALYGEIFSALLAHPQISIGSETMDLTVHSPEKKTAPRA